METLVLRKEWIVHCENCGRPSHCRGALVQDMDEMKAVRICDHCRCRACSKDEN